MSAIPPLPKDTAIVIDKEGVYRWVYEFGLFTNPTILFTVWKILGGIAVAMLVCFGIFDVVNGSLSTEEIFEQLRNGVLFLLFILALSLVGYLVYGWMQGGTYCVIFAMDEEGILHKQLPKQYKKAQVVSALNIIAGIATGKPGQIGTGILSARDSISSNFANVRSIQGIRHRGVIKVNEPLAKNQVYVEPQDYDFVYDYIVSHCPNVTVKR